VKKLETKAIFEKIINHQIEGLMIHSQMADYYDFLGLHGFKRQHEYHYLEESCNMRGVSRYFINHFGKLLYPEKVENPEIIPEAWENFSRIAKQNAVKLLVAEWVDWERETKTLMQKAYLQLEDNGEVAAMLKIKELIEDVDCELKHAERLHIRLKSLNYNLGDIYAMQDEYHHKFKKKQREIGVKIC
jgi:hypothetical protein